MKTNLERNAVQIARESPNQSNNGMKIQEHSDSFLAGYDRSCEVEYPKYLAHTLNVNVIT